MGLYKKRIITKPIINISKAGQFGKFEYIKGFNKQYGEIPRNPVLCIFGPLATS